MTPFSSSLPPAATPSASSRSRDSAAWLSPAASATRAWASRSRLVSKPSGSFNPAGRPVKQQTNNVSC
jgi:hypothetical protein